jgi:hypothetical protein
MNIDVKILKKSGSKGNSAMQKILHMLTKVTFIPGT